MKQFKTLLRSIFVICILASSAGVSNAAVPITTDSRIKTFVYNENEVFRVVVHYGYQSNIEFGKGEEIETISVGNSYSWKITPLKNRLFLRPVEGAAHTNMTVITNKRTYQFEIASKEPDEKIDEELVYVVRFFYPQESFDKPRPVVDTKQFAPSVAPATEAKNFRYTLEGPDNVAPVKVFDDGKSTFMKFKNENANIPAISVVTAGVENQVGYKVQGEYVVIDTIADKFALRIANEVVYVYNESSNTSNGAL